MFHVEQSYIFPAGSGLYVHVPFCKTKCIYCDFVRWTDLSLRSKYVDAAIKEMNQYEIVRPSTIYLGGGTPSVLGVELMQKILSAIEGRFDLTEVEEYTVECNPEDVSDELISTLKNHGVNRISLGVQSLDNEMLKFLNRRHSSARVYEAIDTIRKNGIDNISVDIIFGLPREQYDYEKDLKKFMALPVKHLSAYALSYEEGSMLTRMMKMKKIEPLDDDTVADQYAVLTKEMEKNGYIHYEISNYCKDGYHSRHNSNCWKRVPYLGIGPGASSYDGKRRWTETSEIRDYVEKGAHYTYDEIDEQDVYDEIVMLGLRTREGVNSEDVPAKYKEHFEKTARRLVEQGIVERVEERYRIKKEHWFTLDAITVEFML